MKDDKIICKLFLFQVDGRFLDDYASEGFLGVCIFLVKVCIIRVYHVHSVAISEFSKWQTLFHLQKFKYI